MPGNFMPVANRVSPKKPVEPKYTGNKLLDRQKKATYDRQLAAYDAYINREADIKNRADAKKAAAEAKKNPKPSESFPPITVTQPTPTVNKPEVVQAPSTSTYQSQIDSLLGEIKSQQSSAPSPQQTPFTQSTPSLLPSVSSPTPSIAATPVAEELKISTGSAVTGNAMGFNRVRSSARKANMTGKGTARLRINRTGQTSASSGLNIG